MIAVDIPMPDGCEECPMAHAIRGGEHELALYCEAMDVRAMALMRRQGIQPPMDWREDMKRYLVDEWREERPDGCPILGRMTEKMISEVMRLRRTEARLREIKKLKEPGKGQEGQGCTRS